MRLGRSMAVVIGFVLYLRVCAGRARAGQRRPPLTPNNGACANRPRRIDLLEVDRGRRSLTGDSRSGQGIGSITPHWSA